MRRGPYEILSPLGVGVMGEVYRTTELVTLCGLLRRRGQPFENGAYPEPPRMRSRTKDQRQRCGQSDAG
jgi:hypothetical protein